MINLNGGSTKTPSTKTTPSETPSTKTTPSETPSTKTTPSETQSTKTTPSETQSTKIIQQNYKNINELISSDISQYTISSSIKPYDFNAFGYSNVLINMIITNFFNYSLKNYIDDKTTPSYDKYLNFECLLRLIYIFQNNNNLKNFKYKSTNLHDFTQSQNYKQIDNSIDDIASNLDINTKDCPGTNKDKYCRDLDKISKKHNRNGSKVSGINILKKHLLDITNPNNNPKIFKKFLNFYELYYIPIIKLYMTYYSSFKKSIEYSKYIEYSNKIYKLIINFDINFKEKSNNISNNILHYFYKKLKSHIIKVKIDLFNIPTESLSDIPTESPSDINTKQPNILFNNNNFIITNHYENDIQNLIKNDNFNITVNLNINNDFKKKNYHIIRLKIIIFKIYKVYEYLISNGITLTEKTYDSPTLSTNSPPPNDKTKFLYDYIKIISQENIISQKNFISQKNDEIIYEFIMQFKNKYKNASIDNTIIRNKKISGKIETNTTDKYIYTSIFKCGKNLYKNMQSGNNINNDSDIIKIIFTDIFEYYNIQFDNKKFDNKKKYSKQNLFIYYQLYFKFNSYRFLDNSNKQIKFHEKKLEINTNHSSPNTFLDIKEFIQHQDPTDIIDKIDIIDVINTTINLSSSPVTESNSIIDVVGTSDDFDKSNFYFKTLKNDLIEKNPKDEFNNYLYKEFNNSLNVDDKIYVLQIINKSVQNDSNEKLTISIKYVSSHFDDEKQEIIIITNIIYNLNMYNTESQPHYNKYKNNEYQHFFLFKIDCKDILDQLITQIPSYTHMTGGASIDDHDVYSQELITIYLDLFNNQFTQNKSNIQNITVNIMRDIENRHNTLSPPESTINPSNKYHNIDFFKIKWEYVHNQFVCIFNFNTFLYHIMKYIYIDDKFELITIPIKRKLSYTLSSYLKLNLDDKVTEIITDLCNLFNKLLIHKLTLFYDIVNCEHEIKQLISNILSIDGSNTPTSTPNNFDKKIIEVLKNIKSELTKILDYIKIIKNNKTELDKKIKHIKKNSLLYDIIIKLDRTNKNHLDNFLDNSYKIYNILYYEHYFPLLPEDSTVPLAEQEKKQKNKIDNEIPYHIFIKNILFFFYKHVKYNNDNSNSYNKCIQELKTIISSKYYNYGSTTSPTTSDVPNNLYKFLKIYHYLQFENWRHDKIDQNIINNIRDFGNFYIYKFKYLFNNLIASYSSSLDNVFNKVIYKNKTTDDETNYTKQCNKIIEKYLFNNLLKSSNSTNIQLLYNMNYDNMNYDNTSSPKSLPKYKIKDNIHNIDSLKEVISNKEEINKIMYSNDGNNNNSVKYYYNSESYFTFLMFNLQPYKPSKIMVNKIYERILYEFIVENICKKIYSDRLLNNSTHTPISTSTPNINSVNDFNDIDFYIIFNILYPNNLLKQNDVFKYNKNNFNSKGKSILFNDYSYKKYCSEILEIIHKDFYNKKEVFDTNYLFMIDNNFLMKPIKHPKYSDILNYMNLINININLDNVKDLPLKIIAICFKTLINIYKISLRTEKTIKNIIDNKLYIDIKYHDKLKYELISN
jgi:hypothetical protein